MKNKRVTKKRPSRVSEKRRPAAKTAMKRPQKSGASRSPSPPDPARTSPPVHGAARNNNVEETFRLIFKHSPVGLLSFDAAGSVTDCNDKLLEIFSAPRDKIIGFNIMTEVKDPRLRAATHSALQGKPGYFEGEYTSVVSGKSFYLKAMFGPFLAKDGTASGGIGIFEDMTVRKAIENALVEEKNKFQAIIAAMGDGISIQDRDFKILYQNEMHRKLIGDHVGEYCYRAYGKNDRVCDGCPVALAFHDGKTHTVERGSPDGAIRVEITASPLRNASGAIVAGIEAVRDITERKRTEAALRERERLLQTIIDTEPQCVKIIGPDGKLMMMNPSGLAMIQADSVEQLNAMPDFSFVVPEYQAAFNSLTEDVFRGRSSSLEFEAVGLKGRRLWLETHAVPLRNEEGEIIALLGVTQNITERKKAEAFVRNILETVDEGFIVIDRDYTIISVNKAYAAQAGRPPEEIIGKKCHEISHGIYRPCFEHGEECAVRRTFETGEPHAVVHTHYDKKKNPIYVETKSFPMTDATGRVTAAIEIVNNITEKKKLEDQLRHAQKMEAVGLLAGGIAHDFNNILTAIIGYGNLLEVKLAPDDPLRTYADQILAASARAANLTQSLLAFSRKQVINPRPVDLNEIIARIEKLLHRVIGEDVDLKTGLAPSGLTILADSSQIEQVLMNLATNARDAMPEGGVLTITTGAAVIDEEFRKAYGYGKDGSYAAVTIADTGMGMDEQTRERIFEPFFTTKEMGRGTGLGLAIVYGIMKQNNGYVTVKSAPGKGSVFTLYFPLITAPAERESSLASLRNLRKGSGTILLAEDDAALRQLTRTVLAEFGYTVIEAVDGEDAVRKFREHRDRIQLLILDVIMPRMNGREAYHAIRELRPGITTLFISGHSDNIISRSVLVDDGCHFMAKPVSPQDLLSKVQDLLK